MAAAELVGQLIRTTASVIGHRGSDSVIFATTGWGYTVTVMMKNMRIGFTARPRGWLRKSLAIEGTPIELVAHVLDEAHQAQLLALQPLSVELGPSALRIEQKYGDPADIAATIHLAESLARRAREVEATADDQHFARTA